MIFAAMLPVLLAVAPHVDAVRVPSQIGSHIGQAPRMLIALRGGWEGGGMREKHLARRSP